MKEGWVVGHVVGTISLVVSRRGCNIMRLYWVWGLSSRTLQWNMHKKLGQHHLLWPGELSTSIEWSEEVMAVTWVTWHAALAKISSGNGDWTKGGEGSHAAWGRARKGTSLDPKGPAILIPKAHQLNRITKVEKYQVLTFSCKIIN